MLNSYQIVLHWLEWECGDGVVQENLFFELPYVPRKGDYISLPGRYHWTCTGPLILLTQPPIKFHFERNSHPEVYSETISEVIAARRARLAKYLDAHPQDRGWMLAMKFSLEFDLVQQEG